MTFSDSKSHTNPLFIDLKLLKVRDIIKSQHLKLVYELFKNVLPDYLHSLFDLSRDIHDLHGLFDLSRDIHTTNLELKSAQKYLLYIPSIKTVTYGNKSIKYHCAELGNGTLSRVVLQLMGILNIMCYMLIRFLMFHNLYIYLYNYSLN